MIISVDPGAAGGIAILFHDGSVAAYAMPKTRLELVEIFETALQQDQEIANIPRRTPVRAIVEQVHAMPSQGTEKDGKQRKMGAASAFKFGQNYERPLAILASLKIPTEQVKPQAWQKLLRLSKPKGYKEGKEYLREKAEELFPEIMYGKTLTYRRAVCDALLLIEYGRRKKVDTLAGV